MVPREARPSPVHSDECSATDACALGMLFYLPNDLGLAGLLLKVARRARSQAQGQTLGVARGLCTLQCHRPGGSRVGKGLEAGLLYSPECSPGTPE